MATAGNDYCDALSKRTPFDDESYEMNTMDPLPRISVLRKTRKAAPNEFRADSMLEELLPTTNSHRNIQATAECHFHQSWALEIISMLASIGCFVLIVFGLKKYDNKLVSNWHLPIEPNFLLSSIAAGIKAGLLYPVAQCICQLKWLYFQKSRPIIHLQHFDDASRGLFGCLGFLWNFHFKTAAASILCLITIAAVVIDPFTQQTLGRVDRETPSTTDHAFLPVAQGYNSGLNTTLRFVTAQEIDPPMQLSILQGIYGQPGNTLYTCTTGNCTFPGIWTLGFCASCNDVTNISTSKCTSGETGGHNETCTYTTPGSLNLSATSVISGNGEGQPGGSWATQLDAYATSTPSNRTTYLDIAHLAVLQLPDLASLDLFDKTITECSIQLCERLYDSFSVSNTVAEIPSFTAHELRYVDAAQGPLAGTQASDLRLDFESVNGYNYSVNAADLDTVTYSILGLFRTSLTSESAQIPTQNPTMFDISNTLYRSNNISQLVGNLTDRMSDYLRSATLHSFDGYEGDPSVQLNASSVQAVGVAWKEQTYFQVNWWWLYLPGGVVFMTSILLLFTIWVNMVRQGPCWKSSSLPYLHHPFSMDGVPSHTHSSGTYKGAAKKLRMRLFRTG